MIIKYIFLGMLLLTYGLCTTAENDDSCKWKISRRQTSSLTEENPLNRSPGDSVGFCYPENSKVLGDRQNLIIINGKTINTDSDTTTQNFIRVSGEGNIVLLKQADNKSEVKVMQNGKNNKTVIVQKSKIP